MIRTLINFVFVLIAIPVALSILLFIYQKCLGKKKDVNDIEEEEVVVESEVESDVEDEGESEVESEVENEVEDEVETKVEANEENESKKTKPILKNEEDPRDLDMNKNFTRVTAAVAFAIIVASLVYRFTQPSTTFFMPEGKDYYDYSRNIKLKAPRRW